MTINNAESFFAWDVLSWLFIAMFLAIIIVLIDLFFNPKSKNQESIESGNNKSKIGKFFYFIIFLKF